MLTKILIIGFGGFLGAVSRYLFFLFLKPFQVYGVNISILAINVLGCLVLGLTNTYLIEKNSNLSLFLSVGLLGAFTTFSTFSLEAFNLLAEKKYAESLIYMLSSVILGIVGFALGQKLYQLITR